jgi:hypothetical protein
LKLIVYVLQSRAKPAKESNDPDYHYYEDQLKEKQQDETGEMTITTICLAKTWYFWCFIDL